MLRKIIALIVVLAIPASVSGGRIKEAAEKFSREAALVAAQDDTRSRGRFWTGIALIVGHSNTVMGIIAALGGPRLPDLCDGQYALLHTLTIPAVGTPVLRVSSYGAPDPVGAANCSGAMK